MDPAVAEKVDGVIFVLLPVDAILKEVGVIIVLTVALVDKYIDVVLIKAFAAVLPIFKEPAEVDNPDKEILEYATWFETVCIVEFTRDLAVELIERTIVESFAIKFAADEPTNNCAVVLPTIATLALYV